MFFPSVVLSNCLSRPQKLSPVTYKLQPGNKQSRLKMNKKKLSGHQETSTKTAETGSSKDNYIQNNPCNSNNSEKDNVLANDLIKVTRGTFENKTSTDSFVDCHFGEGTLETEQSFGLYGNKYTLRAKRKVNYENEHQIRIGGKLYHLQNEMGLIAKQILSKCKFYSTKTPDKK